MSALRQAAGYTGKVKIGMDVAASEFFKDGKYDLDFKNKDSDPSSYKSGSVFSCLPGLVPFPAIVSVFFA